MRGRFPRGHLFGGNICKFWFSDSDLRDIIRLVTTGDALYSESSARPLEVIDDTETWKKDKCRKTTRRPR